MVSGHNKLDTLIGGGFERKQLIALTGITKNGKTAMSIDLTYRLEKYAPLWIAFEETIEEIVRKQIKYGRKMPIAFAPLTTNSDDLKWIEGRIIEAVIKHDSRIVFIDHLHFIGMNDIKQDRHDLKLTEIIKGLKVMAKKLDVCIFLVAHLRKVDITEQPTIMDIKETSSLAQWSDKVLIVWREAEREGHKIRYTDITYLNLAADRQTGNQDNVAMKFDKGVFIEMTEGEENIATIGVRDAKKKKHDF